MAWKCGSPRTVRATGFRSLVGLKHAMFALPVPPWSPQTRVSRSLGGAVDHHQRRLVVRREDSHQGAPTPSSGCHLAPVPHQHQPPDSALTWHNPRTPESPVEFNHDQTCTNRPADSAAAHGLPHHSTRRGRGRGARRRRAVQLNDSRSWPDLDFFGLGRSEAVRSSGLEPVRG